MCLEKLLKKWTIKPKKIQLYIDALTHTSFSNENKGEGNYERLEFFGDALIDFEVAKFLFQNYQLDEGAMSWLKSKNVKQDAFAKWAKKLELNKCLRLGNGSQALTSNSSVLSDIFESFLGAVYLDAGRKKVLKILNTTIFKEIRETWHLESKDDKTLLQEFLQASKEQPVRYATKKQKNKIFSSIVKYEGYNLGEGAGATKKDAEKNAAKNALLKLNTVHKG